MKTFTYNGELYIRAVPSKALFRSTLVHNVVNRGDIFAIRVSDQTLTIISGLSEVKHHEHTVTNTSTETINGKRQGETSTPSIQVKRERLSRKQSAEEYRKKQCTLFGNL